MEDPDKNIALTKESMVKKLIDAMQKSHSFRPFDLIDTYLHRGIMQWNDLPGSIKTEYIEYYRESWQEENEKILQEYQKLTGYEHPFAHQ